MHRTLKQETTQPACATLPAQQRVFDRFRGDYNHERPHEALGQEPPAAFYEPSRRPLPVPIWGRDFAYPEGFDPVRSNKEGKVLRWCGRTLFISLALRHCHPCSRLSSSRTPGLARARPSRRRDRAIGGGRLAPLPSLLRSAAAVMALGLGRCRLRATPPGSPPRPESG